MLNTIQLKVLEQRDGDQSCGYFGIFFVSKLSKIFEHLSSAKSQDSLAALMKDLRSMDSFNCFKEVIISELLIESKRKKSDCYPWTDEHIKSGVLERAYLQHLQNNSFCKDSLQMKEYLQRFSNSIAAKHGFSHVNDCINLMEFSVSSLKTNRLSLRTIQFLEYFFNQRLLTNTENFKIFLIGSAIHYVVAAVYKYESGNVDLLYLDAQNHDILHRTKEYIRQQIISKMKFEIWLKSGWKLEQMRELALDSFCGIQFAVTDLIKNCVLNLYTSKFDPFFVRNKLIKMNICDGFLNGFEEQVLVPTIEKISAGDEEKENESKENPCEYVMDAMKKKMAKKEFEEVQFCALLIREWINAYYPPPVIDQNIVNLLKEIKTKSYSPQIAFKRLRVWTLFVLFFADSNNRKIAQIEDDEFWKRLASTVRVLQGMSAQKKSKHTKL